MFNYGQFGQTDFLFFIIILVIAISALLTVRLLLKVSMPYFFTGLVGLIVGLVLGSLISSSLARLPGYYGKWLPIIINVFVTISILDLFLAQAKNVDIFFKKILDSKEQSKTYLSSDIVIDTSVLIDARIEAIAKTGFVMGKILVPQFILNELQAIADSENSTKRIKGRRGLDVLEELQHSNRLKIELIDDFTISRETVDSRLVKVAKLYSAKVLTVDFNLNKIAKIQNVDVLNVNELAESLKPILTPGEEVIVKITQEGKEVDQGVGYLSDGTMIVVEHGIKFLGKEISCEVVRIFQTLAGKMVFVEPKQRKNYRTSLK